MTAKTPEELRERMVEAGGWALCAKAQGAGPGKCLPADCCCHDEARVAIDAALSAADSAGWPQSLIDKACAQAIEECAQVAENWPMPDYMDPWKFGYQAGRRDAARKIRAMISPSPKATP